MATTVNKAFEEFLKDSVRLDPDRTSVAKSSKGWLVGQIKSFPDDGKFPRLHDALFIDYGSFSRKTKIRPLDDIDLMVILDGQGAVYDLYSKTPGIYNRLDATQFRDLCNDGTNTLNSIKVINKFKEYLLAVDQYKKAEVKRNQEAVTLELKTYEWVYDIVPCFYTSQESDGRTFYLIPDGRGNWKKTDPRIDKNRVTTVNGKHTASVLDVIRIIKYWNVRPTMPSAQSYMLENMVLNYYDNVSSSVVYIDMELPKVLQYIANSILSAVPDPKNIQGDLNTLTWDERISIRNRALFDYKRATDARILETGGKMKESIEKWQEIFGNAFPSFTS